MSSQMVEQIKPLTGEVYAEYMRRAVDRCEWALAGEMESCDSDGRFFIEHPSAGPVGIIGTKLTGYKGARFPAVAAVHVLQGFRRSRICPLPYRALQLFEYGIRHVVTRTEAHRVISDFIGDGMFRVANELPEDLKRKLVFRHCGAWWQFQDGQFESVSHSAE